MRGAGSVGEAGEDSWEGLSLCEDVPSQERPAMCAFPWPGACRPWVCPASGLPTAPASFPGVAGVPVLCLRCSVLCGDTSWRSCEPILWCDCVHFIVRNLTQGSLRGWYQL